MNNKKATKRALLTSVTALVMCVVMLAGTTFAWFTDTASTGVNKIVAGNLDVDIIGENSDEHVATLNFTKANAATDAGATEAVLWEPGCRYLTEGFRIANKGNLALKWKAVVNKGTTAANEGNFDLLDVIDFYLVTSKDVGDMGTLLDEFTGTLEAKKTSEDVYYIKGVMKTSAGNDYQGLTLDGITITVYATQYTYEKDSFDDQYDANAAYKGSQEFTSGTHVLNKGGVALATDARPVAVYATGSDTDVTITGGYYDGGSGGEYNIAVWANGGANVTIKDGTFTVGADKNGKANSVIYSTGGNITIEGGFFYTDYSSNGFYYVLNQQNGNPGTITVKGGTFVNYDPSTGDDNLGGNFVADGYSVITETKANGDKWYTVVKGTGVVPSTQESLNDGITNSTNKDVTVVMPANSSLTLDSGIAHEGAKSRDVTFVGDGSQTVDVITNAVSAEGGQLNYQRGSTFTFENMTIQAGEGSFDGIVCDELTYKNCTIKGKLTLYGKATFINCVFENTMANQYSIWTWGGTDVTFEGCTFNTNGKAILLYGKATAAKPTNLTVTKCIFNDSKNGAAGKAAIEIGNDYDATYTLTVNNATVNGFADGKNTNSKLWANKNSMDAAHLTVTIDGSKIQ